MRRLACVLIIAAFLGSESPPPRQCEAKLDFSAPVNLGPLVNSPAFDGGPSLSTDGLALFFTSERPGGSGGGDLWVTKRAKLTDSFGTPQNLGTAVNSPANEFAPSISPDGLSIYFDSDRPGGLGPDIWVAVRATTSEPFGTPQNLGPPVNSSASDGLPSISADGLSLYFCSRRPGGLGQMDLWVARRTSTSVRFAEAENLGPAVNSPSDDWGPSISADGLNLFFMSGRPGGQGGQDIWVVTRASASDHFGTPRNLGPMVNSPALDARPNISADCSTLFFMSDRMGGSGQIDLWQASKRAQPSQRK
jgi:TolB protein